MKQRIFPILTTVFVLGCVNPELSRRYASVAEDFDTKAPVASVAVFSIPKPGSPADKVTALSDHGQAALVKALADRTKSGSELRTELSAALTGAPSLGADFGAITRRLVLSILDENGFEPADRVEKVRMYITLPDKSAGGDATFQGWSRFETDYQTVDLGKITRTESVEASLEPKIGAIGNVLTESVGKIASKEGITEEQNLRRRYVALGGRVEPRRLTILMQGVTGIDLVGTATLDIQLDLGPRYFQPVFTFSENDGKTSLTLHEQRRPQNVCPIFADITGTYTVRKVLSGGRTIPEGDDRVTFLEGKFQSPRQLIVRPAKTVLYKVGVLDSGELWTKSRAGTGYRQTYFPSIAQAVAFRDWVAAQIRAGRAPVLSDGVQVVVYDTSNDRARRLRQPDLGNIVAFAAEIGSCPSSDGGES